MSYKFYLKSDVGNSRSQNQDTAFARIIKTPKGEAFMGIVCDGMGGLANGQQASSYVAGEFSAWFENSLVLLCGIAAEDFGSVLFSQWNEIVTRCNSALMTAQQAPSGTTLSLLLVLSGRYYIAQLGDSRVYLCSAGGFAQLTTDHSYVAGMVDRGLMTKSEAVSSKQRNILTNCIGCVENVTADYYTGAVSHGDIFLISSDGLHGGLTIDELDELIGGVSAIRPVNMKKRILSAIEKKKQLGEKDNITALMMIAAQ